MSSSPVRYLTFVVGTGRSGSTVLSRTLNAHPDVLSLNELLSSIGPGGLPGGTLTGAAFWRLLATPHPTFDAMVLSGLATPEILYPGRPGRRYAAGTTGIPALALMVLPHLTDDPDGLFDELEREVPAWPVRTAAEHYQALFATLGARYGRTAAVERSGFSTHWIPYLRAAFPEARFVHLFRNGPDGPLLRVRMSTSTPAAAALAAESSGRSKPSTPAPNVMGDRLV